MLRPFLFGLVNHVLKLGCACLTPCACCTSVTNGRVRGELQGPSKITKHVEREVISHSNFCHVSLLLLCFAAPFALPFTFCVWKLTGCVPDAATLLLAASVRPQTPVLLQPCALECLKVSVGFAVASTHRSCLIIGKCPVSL